MHLLHRLSRGNWTSHDMEYGVLQHMMLQYLTLYHTKTLYQNSRGTHNPSHYFKQHANHPLEQIKLSFSYLT